MTGNGWNFLDLLEWMELAGNGWKWLEFLKFLKWIDMARVAGKVWKGLGVAEMAGNWWKWLAMAENV